MKTTQLHNWIMKQNPKSYRKKGVQGYAIELLRNTAENYGNKDRETEEELIKAILNGAKGRKEYSRGGCSRIYNRDIATKLSSPSELKKTNYGRRRPNKEEDRLDTQARALQQAEYLITEAFREIKKGE